MNAVQVLGLFTIIGVILVVLWSRRGPGDPDDPGDS